MKLEKYVIEDIKKDSGTSSKGNAWESLELRVCNKEDRFESRLIVRLTPKARESFRFRVGDTVDLDIDFGAHQWGDKWFNEIMCWKIESSPYPQPF